MSEITIRLKGGPGSGHRGHRGIPGQRGGSLPGTGRFLEIDFFTGKPISPPSAKDRKIVSDVIESAEGIGRMKAPPVIIMDGAIMGDAMGSRTTVKRGELKGQRVVVISTSKIDDAIEEHGLSGVGSWLGMEGDLSRKSIMEHVVAHELGHHWYDGRSSGIKESWRQVFAANQGNMSGYSRYYHSVDEGVADSFAGFVLGYNLISPVEDWFLENT